MGAEKRVGLFYLFWLILRNFYTSTKQIGVFQKFGGGVGSEPLLPGQMESQGVPFMKGLVYSKKKKFAGYVNTFLVWAWFHCSFSCNLFPFAKLKICIYCTGLTNSENLVTSFIGFKQISANNKIVNRISHMLYYVSCVCRLAYQDHFSFVSLFIHLSICPSVFLSHFLSQPACY